ncbi:MAG: hypothetical protein F2698_00750 [Actinobacteria bacterium]|nr:hypothetical protein [Actinomycetota bacterium]
MRFFSAVASLIYPAICLSCSRSMISESQQSAICENCIRNLSSKAALTNRGKIQVFAGSKYSLQMSHIILAAKEDNHATARTLLAKQLTKSLELFNSRELTHSLKQSKSLYLIPIPSRRAADRARGYSHIQRLIKKFIELNPNLNIEILDCLHHAKKIKDQSTLNFNERELNMRGAFLIDESFDLKIAQLRNSNSWVFIVDDLVTTGTTVQAANKALIQRGLRVDGVLASCATDGFTH